MTRCIDCHTELPEGARYCFSCGKAVYQIQVRSPSWRLPIETGSLSRRFMDLELYREEQREQEKEYLRNAENFVTVDPEAAALVLYGSEWMHGENIELSVGTGASPQVDVRMSDFHATISPRQLKGRKCCMSAFPAYIFLYLRWKESGYSPRNLRAERITLQG